MPNFEANLNTLRYMRKAVGPYKIMPIVSPKTTQRQGNRFCYFVLAQYNTIYMQNV